VSKLKVSTFLTLDGVQARATPVSSSAAVVVLTFGVAR
jgi:hypothetical protein